MRNIILRGLTTNKNYSQGSRPLQDMAQFSVLGFPESEPNNTIITSIAVVTIVTIVAITVFLLPLLAIIANLECYCCYY